MTEEVRSWWKVGSVQGSSWPRGEELRAPAVTGADPLVLDVAPAVLGEVRQAKTVAQASKRAEVARAAVRDTPERLAALAAAAADVRDAGLALPVGGPLLPSAW